MNLAAWVLIVFYSTRPADSRYEDSPGLSAVDIDAAGGFKPVHVQLMRKDASDSLGSLERANDQTRRHYSSKGSIRNIVSGSLEPTNEQEHRQPSSKDTTHHIGPHTAYDTLAQATAQVHSSQQLQGVDKYEWSPWFSWNTPGRTSNHNHNPVRAMLCLNKMCSNMSLERNVNLPTHGTSRSKLSKDTHITQNDNARKLHCPAGRVVTAVSCSTGHCERMDLTCSLPKGWALDGSQVTQTVEFSEKTGGMSMCDPGYYMYGLSCAKVGCQIKTLYCKKEKKST